MPPERVRVTSSRRGARRVTTQPVARDIAEQTELGDVYLEGLMRAQLRNAVLVLAVALLAVGGLPLLFIAVPSIHGLTIVGIPFPWLVLGVGLYPAAWLLARWYIRQAERVEKDFAEMVDDP